ncbi:MAG: hypothetical protein V2A62_04255 [Candidatus Woesearchaeota archaeon]
MNRIVLGISLLLIFSFSVAADMIPAGMKSVGYCFTLENQPDYSDYVFIMHGGPLAHGQVMALNQCLSFYKFASPRIYAIKEKSFDLEEFNTLIHSYSQDNFSEQLETYYSRSSFLKSDLQLFSYGLVKDYEPLESVQDVLRIEVLNDKEFKIIKSKAIYTYEDGSKTEHSYINHNVPPPRTNQQVYLYFLGLPIVALIILIYLLVKKK